MVIKDENINRSDELLSEAIRYINRAQYLMKANDFSGVVEASQHCIEYSIQMMYHLVGLEHPKPKNHDVGIELEKVMKKSSFVEGYDAHKESLREGLGRLRLISIMWSWAHSTSMYGYLDIPASKIFKESEAKIALDYASEAQAISAKFLYFRKMGIMKVLSTDDKT